MTIGVVARRAGVRSSAIRFYERSGVLPPARRASGQRRYEQSRLEATGRRHLGEGGRLHDSRNTRIVPRLQYRYDGVDAVALDGRRQTGGSWDAVLRRTKVDAQRCARNDGVPLSDLGRLRGGSCAGLKASREPR